ncbi:Nif3-like dinuclear metal center hexameric protein [Ihubacter massiliensis]|uniref:GTP cyclohydrolase 1 type 2 homolog n=1 Tax=Hominibacterium faecale TaxID=2839743 RepID=A0A9J6QV69_9FIRM|nr:MULTISPECIES: Nif3-like dinuclear metal center hexameric protein [Eubacteriales Family XIII. Incertae Sedis]MCI7303480.1 Nif3-like dinuclear metal center hexameric protein [Clostridia bacterium]MDE8732904.1 Nif3-like dinuclear metal center hexameric protein [Eubacteriales bacterium DFI.9.88]MDY3012043.1 Nif3-like dinuclear metal center hexameric protein [Clostridiales Family XIII bacterium]MCO7120922.1 Nif3-like dinuclear metal center hexameric protein [Ihubacter massiliensis]MCU7377838.1 N
MAMKLEDVVAKIEEIASPDTQESWDNSGIQLAAGPVEIHSVLTTLEITDAVIEEADEEGVDLIVTHHPLIFGSLKSIDYRDMVGAYIVRLLNMGVSVYSCHTPFDKLDGGNNDFLAELIGLKDTSGFSSGADLDMIGRVGQLEQEMTLVEALDLLSVKLEMDPEQFRAVGKPDSVIKTVGICTGAGADLMELAAANGCQLFVTGDLKYHDAQKAKALGLAVIDAGHYGTEKSFAGNFADKLIEKTGGQIQVLASDVDIDPFEML